MKALRLHRIIRTAALCAMLLAGVAAFYLFVRHLPLMYLHGDSAQYIEFAKNFSQYFSSADALPTSFVVRSLGYPLLLALSTAAVFGDLRFGVFVLHALLALAAMLATASALKPMLPRLVSCLILSVLVASCWEIFPAVMTEWTAIMLLIVLWSTWIAYLHERRVRTLSISSAVTLFLVLVKPIFILTVILPFALAAAVTAPSTRRIRMVVVALILSPLLVLTIANYRRFGVLSVSPAGALSFAGVAISLAPIPVFPDDSDQTRAIIYFLNDHRLAASASDIAGLSILKPGGLFAAVCKNYGLATELPARFNLGWRDVFSIISLASKRTIAANREIYIRFVRAGIESIAIDLPLLILSLTLPLYLIWRKKLQPVAIANLIFAFLHLATISLVAFVGILHNRYYMTTFIPLVTVTLLLAGCCIREEFFSRSRC